MELKEWLSISDVKLPNNLDNHRGTKLKTIETKHQRNEEYGMI